MKIRALVLICFLFLFVFGEGFCATVLNTGDSTVGERFAPPAGFERVPVESGSFAEFLRSLPLKPGCPPVKLYNGDEVDYRKVHSAVVNLDVGREDLQQCADSIIRLRAEYLWKTKRYRDLSFSYTNGFRSEWLKWRDGWRPVVSGNRVKLRKRAAPDNSYKNFRDWLDDVFMYAGTLSLARDCDHVGDIKSMKAGDFFVDPGSPGHAVITVDIAVDKTAGRKVFLLAQGFMPAQEMHILVNPSLPEISPWYDADFGDTLLTPRWDFKKNQLRRFSD